MSNSGPVGWLDDYFLRQAQNGSGQLLPARPIVQYTGSGVTVTDDAANNRTVVTISGGGGGGTGQNAVTLSNGLNSNIATGSLPSVRASGPTGAFSVGGFAPSGGGSWAGGQSIDFINTTAEVCTLIDSDASSTSTNQILTGSSVPVVVPPYGNARLVYDGASSRFRIVSILGRGMFQNVKDYGAKGDGSTDDTNAINSAMTVAAVNGGTVYLPAGIYVVRPNVLKFSASNVVLQGECKGGYDIINSFNTTGSALKCNGHGTIIAGPTRPGSPTTANSNVLNCGIKDLGLQWVSTLDNTSPGVGSDKAIDFTGVNQSVFERLVIALPSNCGGYGCYGTTWTNGSAQVASFFNTFADIDIFARATASDSSKGHYWAFNAADPTHDGGGVNTNYILGGSLNSCDYSFYLEHFFGATIIGPETEAAYTAHVHVGESLSGTAVSGDGAVGLHCEIRYIEAQPTAYFVEFGAGANGNSIRLGNMTNSEQTAGTTIAGLINPNSVRGNNKVEYYGGFHGTTQIFPPATITTGTYEGVFSGDAATKIMSLKPTSGLTVGQLETRLNTLIQRMQYGGLMEPYTPELEPNIVNWWRADYGQLRYPTSAASTWNDIIAGNALTASGTVTYQDTNFQIETGLFPTPIQRPFMSFTGAGSMSATLSSSVSTCSIVVVAWVDTTRTALNGLVELTPSGSQHSGVAMQYNGATGNVEMDIDSTGGGAVTSVGPITAIQLGISGYSAYIITVDNSNGIFYSYDDTGTTVTSTSLPSMSKLVIGALAGGSSNKLHGNISEVIVYSGKLTGYAGGTGSVYALRRYLVQHYGIWPGNFL